MISPKPVVVAVIKLKYIASNILKLVVFPKD